MSVVWKAFRVIGILFVVATVVILIGASLEDSRTLKQKKWSSLGNFVCATSSSLLLVTGLSTWPSSLFAHERGEAVAHCGDCGKCSTRQDIDIYAKTRNTLTSKSKTCALRSLWGGPEAVRDCFKKKVGFTPGCNTCWTENVMCDRRFCVFTCLKSILLGESNNRGEDKLSNCLLCDERMCGPAFIKCAGANRRRCGITSDIGRDDQNELCQTIDVGWATGLN